MGKASRQKQEKASKKPTSGPWLSMRTGLGVNTLVSLGVALFVGLQIYAAGGLREAVLWGGRAGLSVWVVFFIVYLFNTWLRRR